MDIKTIAPALLLTLFAAACSTTPALSGGDGATDARVSPGPAEGSVSAPPTPPDAPQARRIDPRDGGLEVALGEWALTLEAEAIRPGRVTFVVTNRGTVPHGFEIEAEGRDSSGSGSGDGLKAETRVLDPGETTRLTLNLAAGTYKVECLVDGHDDLGMEGFLEVRRDAPLVRVGSAVEGEVTIEGFAFAPERLTVPPSTEVTWTNADTVPHTVTAEDGSFDSGTLEPGETFTATLGPPGSVAYLCAIHPEMRGSVTVG